MFYTVRSQQGDLSDFVACLISLNVLTCPFTARGSLRLCSMLNPALYTVSSSSMVLYVHRDHTDYSGRAVQDGHLDFHTAPEPCTPWMGQYIIVIWTYEPSRSLRSSNEKLLKIPKRNLKSFGQRSFSFIAPSLWNSLPAILRNVPTLSQFKSQLKTFLFAQALL